jgi:hypothetical protein
MLFLHMRHAGGTTICDLAKKSGLRVPTHGKRKPPITSCMGMNCNPVRGRGCALCAVRVHGCSDVYMREDAH